MKKKDKPAIQPDPKTKHTTDPQEHMEGPVSSVVQSVKEQTEKNAKKDAEEGKEAAVRNKS